MKFMGHGIVWDGENNRPLCKFKDGQLETEDSNIAEKLKNAGYKFEGEIKKTDISDERTIKELKALLDEKGIEYDSKAKKPELIELLKTPEDKDPQEDSTDENENKESKGAE